MSFIPPKGTHTVAYVMKRKPGMSLEAFLDYYEHKHAACMVELMKDKGLVAYTHYPVRPVGPGDDYVPEEGPAYDAISVYTFETGEQASAAWNLPEVVVDSQEFIDFDTMVMMPLDVRQVFPIPAKG